MNGTKLLWLTALSFLLLGVLHQCKKKQSFSKIPEIEYIGFQLLQSEASSVPERGVLMFSYTDGDGDIGLSQGDTTGIFGKDSDYYFNLWITYQERQNGDWKTVYLVNPQTLDTTYLHARVPVLMPNMKNKNIHGEIFDTIPVNNPLSDFDTIRFKVELIDKALNHSNVIETPAIVLPKAG